MQQSVFKEVIIIVEWLYCYPESLRDVILLNGYSRKFAGVELL
jgi:hypothetical protein